MVPTVRFLRWVDPLRVNDTPEEESLVDQEMRDVLESYGQRPFRPGGAHMLVPGGFIPMSPHNSPSELYDFWVMHTNFDISPKIFDAIKAVPGVEIFRAWTRYRCWLGIGRLFEGDTVKQDIMSVVRHLFSAPSKDPLGEMTRNVAAFPSWAIVKDPTGRIRPITGTTDQEVISQTALVDYVMRASWR